MLALVRLLVLRFALLPVLALLAHCGPSTGFVRDAGAVENLDAGSDAAEINAIDASLDASVDLVAIELATLPDAPGNTETGAMCMGEISMPPYADRTSNGTFTDPEVCANCPSAFSGLEELTAPRAPTDTVLAIEGSARGASRCEWYVSNASCGTTHGTALTDPDGTGNFTTTVPLFCGSNTLRLVCENSSGRRVLVQQVNGPMCDGRDLRLTLSWDDRGQDLELHLLRAPRALNSMTDDCTWFTCMSTTGLEWGAMGNTADNPRKDIDNTGTFGPENIFLDQASPGTYHVLVEHWGRSGEPSEAFVDVLLRERSVARLHRSAFVRQHVWYLGTVTFPSGTFTPIDRDIDCTSNWMSTSRGCDLPLP